MIPPQIQKQHVLQAAEQIDRDGVPHGRRSHRYDVMLRGQPYPPKYVISLASRFATRDELPPSRYTAEEARTFLDTLGFDVIDRQANAPAANPLEEDVPPLAASKARLYYVMMAMVGATIGAIAGLSNTSVTNTLIELVASVVAGSAGFYFINRKTLTQEGEALRSIGLLGALFVGVFWIAYLPTAYYRYHDSAYYKWEAEGTPLHRHLALSEIYGHAQKLGIAYDDLKQALERKGVSTVTTDACELLHKDAQSVSDLVSSVYLALATRERVDKQLSSPARYLAERFSATANLLRHSDSEKRKEGEQMRDEAVASLIRLVQDHPGLGEPMQTACCCDKVKVDDAGNTNDCNDATRGCDKCRQECREASDLQRMLATCPDIWLVDALVTIRGHASAFHKIWGEDVSTQPPKRPFTFEMGERQ